jgi:hypothetical protein
MLDIFDQIFNETDKIVMVGTAFGITNFGLANTNFLQSILAIFCSS